MYDNKKLIAMALFYGTAAVVTVCVICKLAFQLIAAVIGWF